MKASDRNYVPQTMNNLDTHKIVKYILKTYLLFKWSNYYNELSSYTEVKKIWLNAYSRNAKTLES